MTSLWAQLEPLLAKVGKPARYIGCDDEEFLPGLFCVAMLVPAYFA